MILNNTLDNLCKEFDINNVKADASRTKSVTDQSQRLKTFGLSSSDLEHQESDSNSNGEYNLEDRDYIRDKMKTLIDDNVEILGSIKEQIEDGATAQLFNIYSSLSKRVGENIMNLAKINGMVVDCQVKSDNKPSKSRSNALSKYERDAIGQNEDGLKSVNNEYNIMNNLSISSDELLKLMNKAIISSEPKNSSDFKISRDELPEFDLS